MLNCNNNKLHRYVTTACSFEHATCVYSVQAKDMIKKEEEEWDNAEERRDSDSHGVAETLHAKLSLKGGKAHQQVDDGDSHTNRISKIQRMCISM